MKKYSADDVKIVEVKVTSSITKEVKETYYEVHIRTSNYLNKPYWVHSARMSAVYDSNLEPQYYFRARYSSLAEAKYYVDAFVDTHNRVTIRKDVL